jgi:competence protein ComFC
VINIILDILFPRSKNSKVLSSLNNLEIYNRCKKSDSKYSVFSYKDPLVKELVWNIKFRGQRKYAKICASYISKKIQSYPNYTLIPVPLHSNRLKERGFNQTEWLCEEIIKITNSKYNPNILKRIRHTPKQSRSNFKERRENIRGAFSIQKKPPKYVILIDDVKTTGATTNEIQRVLLNAGTIRVITFTIAS